MSKTTLRASLQITVKTEGMTEQQVRLVKSLVAQAEALLNATTEENFFKATDETVKVVVAMAKQSHFTTFHAHDENIAYAEQAVEMALDNVTETLYKSESNIFDN